MHLIGVIRKKKRIQLIFLVHNMHVGRLLCLGHLTAFPFERFN